MMAWKIILTVIVLGVVVGLSLWDWLTDDEEVPP